MDRLRTVANALGWVVLLRAFLKVIAHLRRYFRRRNIENLFDKYGSEGCWAVVTGASSGVGEEYAKTLAKRGFNVLLVARREENLLAVRKQILLNSAARVEYLTFDFGDAVAEVDRLKSELLRITKGNMAIVVHMAGNSDLAVHFTDKSLRRNTDIVQLQTQGTLVMVQIAVEIMLTHRRQRSAIITAGALTSYVTGPGFAVASGNKAFVRFFTMAAAHEFREKIDIMCAHPIAVTSEILKANSPAFLTSKEYAELSLGDLGALYESNGSAFHDFIVWLIETSPTSLFLSIFHGFTPWYSKFLQRPIDSRPLVEKFPYVGV